MAMYERDFVRSAIKEPGAPPLAAYKFTCAKCGKEENLPLGSKSGGIPLALVKQKMLHKGWEIGNRASADICPDCLSAGKKQHKHQKQENNVVNFIKAEEPPTMSREDRRLIFAKIDEVYLDENTGYSDGWTDQKVADDLGVPVAWVKSIRAENFGEERSNSAILKQLEEAKETLAQAKKLHDQTKSDIVKMSAQSQNVMAEFNKVQSQLTKAQKELNSLNHEIARQESKIADVWKSLGK